MTKDNQIAFTLKGIHTEEFATFEDCYNSEEKIEVTKNFGFGASVPYCGIAVKFGITFKCNSVPFIKLVVICEFEVDENAFQNFENKKTKTYRIPKGFLTHLSVITVGTARGILHAKLEKTKFQEFLLPMMDIKNILEEDLEIPI